jgi:hypothetical protein
MPPAAFDARALPRIVFVLGKGGVGRSTVAAALGLRLAEQGARVLVLQWAVADVIGPWFGAPAAGATPVTIAPRLAVANFSLDETLRAYFVDHLHLGLIYRHVVRSPAVARLIEVAPGLAELLFVGNLWWLTTLAEREAGWAFDRIIVDAPATGHGASILDVPATLATMGASKLLAVEARRVIELMADPARTGALVVGLPEPLVVDETLELVARVTARLGRPPLGLFVNRSAADLASADPRPGWLDALAARLSPRSGEVIVALHDELRAHVEVEHQLRQQVAGAIATGVRSLTELPGRAPLDVVRTIALSLGAPS